MRNAPLYSETPRRARPGGGKTAVSRDRLEPEDLLGGLEQVADPRAHVFGRHQHVDQGVELVRSELPTARSSDDGIADRAGDGGERAAVHLEREVDGAVTGRVRRGQGARELNRFARAREVEVDRQRRGGPVVQ